MFGPINAHEGPAPPRQTGLSADAERASTNKARNKTAVQPQPEKRHDLFARHHPYRHDVRPIDHQPSLQCPDDVEPRERNNERLGSDFDANRHAARSLLCGFEALFQVGENVVDGLETNRQTHEAWKHAGRLLLFRCELAVRC